MAGGGNVTSRGQGTLESIGGHKWRFFGTNRLSDGSVNIAESIGDLAARTISGKLFESV
jgi:hypothetical protein